MNTYKEKFNKAIQNTIFKKLPNEEQLFITQKAYELKFSYQEIKQIIDMARDFDMWGEKSIQDYFPEHSQRKVVFNRLRKIYEDIRDKPNSYKDFKLKNIPKEQKYSFKTAKKDGFGLGLCPVALFILFYTKLL